MADKKTPPALNRGCFLISCGQGDFRLTSRTLAAVLVAKGSIAYIYDCVKGEVWKNLNIFGKEETEIISPAVKSLVEKGLDIKGPVPPDSAFNEKNRDKFNTFVCMYHDQGLIPLKTLTFYRSCQLSIGLDFLRVSVSHGTAFDIAGKNEANPDSFIYALEKTKELI